MISALSDGNASVINSIVDEVFNDIKDDGKLNVISGNLINTLDNKSIKNGVSGDIIDNFK